MMTAAAILGPVHPAGLAAQNVSGRVVALAGQDPIDNAMVWLGDTERRMWTDSLGSFVFENVEPGHYELRVRHPAYHEWTQDVDVPAEGLADLTISLALRAIPLDAIVVQGLSADALKRRALASGISAFVGRDELNRYERYGANRVEDVLRRYVPSVTVTDRVGSGICIQSTHIAPRPGPVQADADHTSTSCSMAVFVDGAKEDPTYVHDLPTSEIYSIEYMKPIDAAFRFGPVGSRGALIITTRQGALETLRRMSEESRDAARHRSFVFAGATGGTVAGLGIAYAQGMFDKHGGVGVGDVFQFVGTVLVGAGIGELVYRLTGR